HLAPVDEDDISDEGNVDGDDDEVTAMSLLETSSEKSLSSLLEPEDSEDVALEKSGKDTCLAVLLIESKGP
ncbi:hypothetical protein BGX21_005587, partial [Mortierella sp. AD011]